MKDGSLTGPTQQQRDKLTAKRLFAVFASVGLIFGLWVLSTPAHQVYWAAQARLTEAKKVVFAPGSSGDQHVPRSEPFVVLYTPHVIAHGRGVISEIFGICSTCAWRLRVGWRDAVCDTSGACAEADITPARREATAASESVTPLHSDEAARHNLDNKPDPAQDRPHTFELFKRAQDKVSQLWSSDTGDRELLESSRGPAHISQGVQQADGTDALVHTDHSLSMPDNATSLSSAAPDPTDVQKVFKEAEELGFKAALSATQLPAAAAAQQLGLPANDTSQRSPASDASNPAHRIGVETSNNASDALMTEDDDQMSWDDSTTPVLQASSSNGSLSLGQASNESSSRLSAPEDEAATSFAIKILASDALSDESVDALVEHSKDEEIDPAVPLF